MKIDPQICCMNIVLMDYLDVLFHISLLIHVLCVSEVHDLSNEHQVRGLHESFVALLQEYCTEEHPDQPNRFAKLLMFLTSLCDVGDECKKTLFYDKCAAPVDTYLTEKLQNPSECGR